MICARSAIWLRCLGAAGVTTTTVNTTIAIPVLNQAAPAVIGKIDDQKVGNSDSSQSIEAKLAENASRIRATPLSHDSAGAIGSPSSRGPNSAKAAMAFHNTT